MEKLKENLEIDIENLKFQNDENLEKELLEKRRVGALVKEMNKSIKKSKPATANQKANKSNKKAPIRFPGI
ncbi:hypothetical protein [uncultured Campylobacter sp.]|uniref:hypothetical protein n=1 Tax=uncultured Campylobacter sp. TaxID=218934 RepID=UPI002628911A|nr:hypothetical protein [uncultured Campylobacter sp.]